MVIPTMERSRNRVYETASYLWLDNFGGIYSYYAHISMLDPAIWGDLGAELWSRWLFAISEFPREFIELLFYFYKYFWANQNIIYGAIYGQTHFQEESTRFRYYLRCVPKILFHLLLIFTMPILTLFPLFSTSAVYYFSIYFPVPIPWQDRVRQLGVFSAA